MAYSYYGARTPQGHLVHEAVSALQKAIRRSQSAQAAYWAAQIDLSSQSGGKQAWNRLLIICSEDVGLAEPAMPATIWALYQTWLEQKRRASDQKPERLMLVHAAMLLARAKKSRAIDHAVHVTYTSGETVFDIPDEARDRHTSAGRRLGHGLEHWYTEGAKLVNEADLGEDPYAAWSKELDYTQSGGDAQDQEETLFE